MRVSLIDLEELFKTKKIPFEIYHHRAIYTNEDALVIKAEQGFKGTETKSLYLKDKKDRHYIYFTFTTKKSDFKRISKLIGTRVSVVSSEIMEKITGQKAGAVSPFGYLEDTPIIIDKELLRQEKLVFAPGRPDRTMVVCVSDLEQIFNVLKIKTYLLEEE